MQSDWFFLVLVTFDR